MPRIQNEGRAGVRTVDYDNTGPAPSPPVRRITHPHPHANPAQPCLLDFGQNLAGRHKLRVHGVAGTVITARHAEVIEDGELCVRPLRSALATNHFTMKRDDDTFEPTMPIHGFRRRAHGPVADAVSAVVIDVRPALDLSRSLLLLRNTEMLPLDEGPPGDAVPAYSARARTIAALGPLTDDPHAQPGDWAGTSGQVDWLARRAPRELTTTVLDRFNELAPDD